MICIRCSSYWEQHGSHTDQGISYLAYLTPDKGSGEGLIFIMYWGKSVKILIAWGLVHIRQKAIQNVKYIQNRQSYWRCSSSWFYGKSIILPVKYTRFLSENEVHFVDGSSGISVNIPPKMVIGPAVCWGTSRGRTHCSKLSLELTTPIVQNPVEH